MANLIWSKVTGVTNATGDMRVAYGAGRFVAIRIGGISTNVYVHSTDGVTWDTNDVLPVAAFWKSISFGAGVFVLTIDDYTTSYYTSTDGLTWTARTLPGLINDAIATFVNSQFVLFAGTGGNGAGGYKSTDGITWTAITMPVDGSWTAITYGNSTYLATRNGGYAYSADLTTWTAVTSFSVEYGCAFGATRFLRVLSNGLLYSEDNCVTWTISNLSAIFPGEYNPSFATYAVGPLSLFLVPAVNTLTSTSYLVSSRDGVTWGDEGITSADVGVPTTGNNGSIILYMISTASMSAELLNIGGLSATASATEAFEALITAFFASAADGTDAVATQEILNLRAVANVTLDQLVAGQLFSTLADFVNARDDLRQLVYGVLTVEADATEALDSFYQQIELLRARAHAVDPLLSSQTVELALLTVATALDLIANGYDAELLAEADTLDALVDSLQANAALLAAALAAHDLADSAIFSAALTDEVAVDDTLDAAAQLNAFLEAGGEASVYLRLAGEDYTAWVLNLDNIAVTEYRNYEFNSFADFNGTYYGAADDGLYTLGGDTDAGAAIPAWIRTGLSNYGTGAVKRVPMMYVGYTAANGLVLKVAVTDKGVKTEHWFRLEARDATATRADRGKIGKGLAAVYWQWELRNIAGGDFDLDAIRLWPMVLSRRVR